VIMVLKFVSGMPHRSIERQAMSARYCPVCVSDDISTRSTSAELIIFVVTTKAISPTPLTDVQPSNSIMSVKRGAFLRAKMVELKMLNAR